MLPARKAEDRPEKNETSSIPEAQKKRTIAKITFKKRGQPQSRTKKKITANAQKMRTTAVRNPKKADDRYTKTFK